jgi:hypothetical protein
LNRPNILIQFDISVKVARLIKMCSSEIYSNVRLDKHLCDTFPLEYAVRKVQ